MKLYHLLFIAANLGFSYLVLNYSYSYLKSKNFLDYPNKRSLHSIPKVRGGGIAIMISYELFMTLYYLSGSLSLPFFLSQISGGLILGTSGWLDDKRSIHAGPRFIAQVVSALAALYFLDSLSSITILGTSLNLTGLGNILFILYAVWMINLYNFMDGIDSIAVSQLIIPSVFLVFFFLIQGPGEMAMVPLLAISSSIFFYRYNWPPSKMFIGDVLSGFLGYYFAVFTLHLNNKTEVSIFLIPILMAVYIYDATVTLIKRSGRREKIWEAHSNHYYQKFAKKYGHKKVVLIVILADLLLFIPAYLTLKYPQYDLFICLITYAILGSSVHIIDHIYLKQDS